MRSREYAELLLRKAGQDEYALQKLITDPDAPDEVIGFHAQQAVEKMLKAVLALKSIRFRRTHDLVELVDLLRESDISCPEGLDEVCKLGPFAAEFRYDDLPLEPEESFDRSWVLGCIHRTRAWAEAVYGRAEP